MLKKKYYGITKQTYKLVFSNLPFVFFHFCFLYKLIKILTLSESKNRKKQQCVKKKTLEDKHVDLDSSKVLFSIEYINR
jgi:hypothetical protein